MQYELLELRIPDETSISAKLISNDNTVLLSSRNYKLNGQPRQYQYVDGKFKRIGHFTLSSVNNKGDIVGNKFSTTTAKSIAVIYQNHHLHALLKPSFHTSVANSINDDAITVGYVDFLNRYSGLFDKRNGFIAGPKELRILDNEHGFDIEILASINNLAWTCGTLQRKPDIMNTNPQIHGVVRKGEQLIYIPIPEDFAHVNPIKINDRGDVLCRAISIDNDFINAAASGVYLQNRNVIFKQKTFIYNCVENSCSNLIDGLGRDINNSGDVVGVIGINAMSQSTIRPMKAFLWKDSEMYTVESLVQQRLGQSITEANGINDKGSIVGAGKESGRQFAYIARMY